MATDEMRKDKLSRNRNMDNEVVNITSFQNRINCVEDALRNTNLVANCLITYRRIYA